MANLLKGQAIGRLTKPPYFDDKNNDPYAALSIAVNKKSGDNEDTYFVDVAVYGKQAESVNDNLTTGDEIYVDGDLILREFDTKDNGSDKVMKIFARTVQFLKVAKWESGNGNGNSNGRGNGRSNDRDDAPRGRTNGNGNGNGNGRGNGNGNGQRTRF